MAVGIWRVVNLCDLVDSFAFVFSRHTEHACRHRECRAKCRAIVIFSVMNACAIVTFSSRVCVNLCVRQRRSGSGGAETRRLGEASGDGGATSGWVIFLFIYYYLFATCQLHAAICMSLCLSDVIDQHKPPKAVLVDVLWRTSLGSLCYVGTQNILFLFENKNHSEIMKMQQWFLRLCV